MIKIRSKKPADETEVAYYFHKAIEDLLAVPPSQALNPKAICEALMKYDIIAEPKEVKTLIEQYHYEFETIASLRLEVVANLEVLIMAMNERTKRLATSTVPATPEQQLLDKLAKSLNLIGNPDDMPKNELSVAYQKMIKVIDKHSLYPDLDNKDKSKFFQEDFLQKKLGDQIGMDSLDGIALIIALEQEFQIEISDEEKIDLKFPNTQVGKLFQYLCQELQIKLPI